MTVAYPKQTDRNVMKARAERAPENTSSLELVMANMAAMKKVLSPISETIMTDNDARNA